MMEDFSQYNGEGTTLRKVQLRLVDMMVEIDRICRKHNIKYWITFGTLLGAVRHGGFIPWDDDLDICMLSDDLKKFIEVAPNELPDTLFLQTKETDPSIQVDIVKVRLKNSLFIIPHEDFLKNYNKGLFVDLFEVIPYPNINPAFRRFIFKWYTKISGFYSYKQRVTFKNHVATLVFPVIRFVINVVWSLIKLGPKNRLGYQKHLNIYGNSYTKDAIFPLKDIQFEGHTFLGPADPDQYLKSTYGDYMKLPPKESRRSHMIHVELD